MIPYDQLPHDEDNHVEPRLVVLTDAQIQQIAAAVAARPLTKAEMDVMADYVEDRLVLKFGRKTLEKLWWVLGISVIALMTWLGGKGLLK